MNAGEVAYDDRVANQDTQTRLNTLFGNNKPDLFASESSSKKSHSDIGKVDYETVDEQLTSDTTEIDEMASESEKATPNVRKSF